MLSIENRRWLKAFQEKHGRSPRVLHIGNIANNAYNNAKILNQAGIDSDVICYDYYHIMGCPEWEDADLNDPPQDDFFPDWREVDLKGFHRPSWFAQGNLLTCIRYLTARRLGEKNKAEQYWKHLAFDNKTASNSFITIALVSTLNFSRKLRRILFKVPSEIVRSVERYCKGKKLPNFVLLLLASAVLFLAATTSIVLSLPRWLNKIFSLGNQVYQEVRFQRDPFLEVIDSFATEFPQRQDKLSGTDILSYNSVIGAWQDLLRYYDFVIGYSTDPIIPLLSGVPYLAFEHGTIRQIPYNETAQGRCTALSYRRAEHVFVTNFDCLDSACILAPNRYTLINHPYDEDHCAEVSGSEELRSDLCLELDSDFLFFFPTRHDWVAGTGCADKSNDIFLRAFAELRSQGFRVGLICCSWGANINESKDLIKKLNCSGHVKWVKPLAMVKFERMALAANCVVDQFKLGAFGGVVFKALAAGAPVLTFLDESKLLKQYAKCPPVINCRNELDIVEKMVSLIEHPQKLEEIGVASRVWMKKFHSKESTVNAQVEQFKLMDGRNCRPNFIL